MIFFSWVWSPLASLRVLPTLANLASLAIGSIVLWQIACTTAVQPNVQQRLSSCLNIIIIPIPIIIITIVFINTIVFIILLLLILCLETEFEHQRTASEYITFSNWKSNFQTGKLRLILALNYLILVNTWLNSFRLLILKLISALNISYQNVENWYCAFSFFVASHWNRLYSQTLATFGCVTVFPI